MANDLLSGPEMVEAGVYAHTLTTNDNNHHNHVYIGSSANARDELYIRIEHVDVREGEVPPKGQSETKRKQIGRTALKTSISALVKYRGATAAIRPRWAGYTQIIVENVERTKDRESCKRKQGRNTRM